MRKPDTGPEAALAAGLVIAAVLAVAAWFFFGARSTVVVPAPPPPPPPLSAPTPTLPPRTNLAGTPAPPPAVPPIAAAVTSTPALRLPVHTRETLAAAGTVAGFMALLDQARGLSDPDLAPFANLPYNLGDPVLRSWLCDRLAQEEDPAARQTIQWALASSFHPDVLDALAAGMDAGTDAVTRARFEYPVRLLRDPVAVPALIALSAPGSEPMDAAALAAIGALGAIGNEEAASHLAARLLTALAESDPGAADVKSALASIHSPYAVRFLERLALCGDESLPREARLAAVEALATQSGPEVEEALSGLANDPDETIRRESYLSFLRLKGLVDEGAPPEPPAPK